MAWYKYFIATGKDTAMNIDTINYGPFRVTDYGKGHATLMDTRTGASVNMRKPFAEIRKEAIDNAKSGVLAYDAIVAALEKHFNPCL